MSNELDELIYNRKQLDKARTISIIALVGSVIPIVGLILALVAAGINSGVEITSKIVKQRKKVVYLFCGMSLVLSITAGVGYYTYYNYLQEQKMAAIEAEAQKQNDEKNAAQAAAAAQRLMLENCLNSADKQYWAYVELNSSSSKKQADGTTVYTAPTTVWNAAEANRTTAKNECYRRYN